MLFPSGFDRTIALEAGALVKQAYVQFDRFTAKQPWNLEGPYDALGLLNAKPEELLGHQEPFGFVARSQVSGKVFVTFRGTKSLGDWLSDFSFPQVAHPWGRVEKGFASLCEQCAASVENAVKAARATGPASEVIVTGHSPGGGLGRPRNRRPGGLESGDVQLCRAARGRSRVCLRIQQERGGCLAYRKYRGHRDHRTSRHWGTVGEPCRRHVCTADENEPSAEL